MRNKKTPGSNGSGIPHRQLSLLVAKFTKSAAITRSLLNQVVFVHASCSFRSAPFAFIEIVA